ncbi:MAG: hypothetical protein ACYC4A_14460 [Desulfobulbia bacterium]
MGNRQKISITYNLALFTYFCVNFLVTILFDTNLDAKAPWDVVYESYPALSIIAALAIGVVLLLWGASIIKSFWNRLVSDIFSVRELEFQEALAMVLILAIVGS